MQAGQRRSDMLISAEQCTLGGLLISPSRIADVDIEPGDFVRREHSLIFRAIVALHRTGASVDVVTLAEHMERAGDLEPAGGLAYLGSLANETPSAHNVLSYAKIVKDASINRRARGIMENAILEMPDDGPAAIERAITDLMHLIDNGRVTYECTISDAVMTAVNRLEYLEKNPGMVGVTTGLEKLDAITGGMQGGDFNVVAARPSMGKTALLLNFASAAAKVGHAAGILSAEQPRLQIGQRVLSLRAQIVATRMRVGRLDQADWAAIVRVMPELQKLPIYVNDRPGMSIAHVVNQSRRWKHDRDIRILYVDYLQLIRGTDRRAKKLEQVGEVAYELKQLARELDIPVVALAQVSRDVERRENKRPGMADLSDSSEIEKHADSIMTLYRDEVYRRDTKWAGIAEIIMCKNRHGPIGVVRAKWNKQFMEFDQLSAEEQKEIEAREDG